MTGSGDGVSGCRSRDPQSPAHTRVRRLISSAEESGCEGRRGERQGKRGRRVPTTTQQPEVRSRSSGGDDDVEDGGWSSERGNREEGRHTHTLSLSPSLALTRSPGTGRPAQQLPSSSCVRWYCCRGHRHHCRRSCCSSSSPSGAHSPSLGQSNPPLTSQTGVPRQDHRNEGSSGDENDLRYASPAHELNPVVRKK